MEPGDSPARKTRSAADPTSDGSGRRDGIAAAIALVVHAAALALVTPFAREVAPPAPPPPDEALIEIDLRVLGPRPPEPVEKAVEPVAVGAVAGSARSDTRSGVPRGGPSEPLSGPEPPAPGSAAPSPPSAPAPVPSNEYGETPIVPIAGAGPLGGTELGGSAWAIPGVLSSGSGPDLPSAAGTAAANAPVGPRAAVDQGKGATLLRDDLRAHDASLGIGTQGGTVVMNAVADAVRASTVPKEATATIVARVGGDGTLQSIKVYSFSAGDQATWNAVAAAALGAVGKKKLALAGLGKRGAIVTVAVQTVYTKPSGSGDRPSRSVAQVLADGPDRTVAPAPSPDGDACAPERHSDLPPLCGVGMTVGGFDITDIATRKHRYVRASFGVKLLEDAPAVATSAPVSAPVSVPVPSAKPAATAPAP